jgi:hypothetical protein
MNKDAEWHGLKELFIFDILNCFVNSSLQADIRDSLELRQIFRGFAKDSEPIQMQIIKLLRG